MDKQDKLLDRRLQDAFRVEPPANLQDRLREIADTVPQPAESPRGTAERIPAKKRWLLFEWRLAAVPALSVAVAFAILWTAGVRILPDEQTTADNPPALTAEQQAVRDFVIAMTYLQASTARVNREVNSELGAGLMAAFERGEQSFKDSSKRVTNGG